MSLKATAPSPPAGPVTAYPQYPAQYGGHSQQYGGLQQVPSYSMPISGSSTFNILAPAIPQSPPPAGGVSCGPELYATHVAIGDGTTTTINHQDGHHGIGKTTGVGIQTHQNSKQPPYQRHQLLEHAQMANANTNTPHHVGVNTPHTVGVNTPHTIGVNTPHSVGVNTPHHVGVNTPHSVGVNTPHDIGVNTPHMVRVQTHTGGGAGGTFPPQNGHNGQMQMHNMGTQVTPAPQTKCKPSRLARNGSMNSSASSGVGSMPSSPLMTSSGTTDALAHLRLHDAEADAESLTWSSLDDTRSEQSYNSSGNGEYDSACSVETPGEDNREEVITHDRTGIVCDDRTAVMVQVACESEEGTSNEKFADLVANIATAVAQYFRKKEAVRERMNSTQVNQVIMPDRRPVKDHLKDISESLGENVTVTRADCRRVSPGKQYVGTYVMDNVTYRGRSSVSKHGVIVVLKKLNKFACTKEFAEQLCLHILATRPEALGKGELSTTLEARKKPVNPRHLLTQRFYCDQTCNVYEAGKRSFVEVTDYVLY